MKASLIAFVPICVLLAAYAHPSQESAVPKANDADVRLLETKIRQAWEDYKNKNKEALARIFTSDAIEVEEGAEGPHNMKATLAEIDDFNMKSYSLTDFHYRSIGSNSMLGSLQCRIHSKRSRRRDPQQIDHRRSFGKDSW